MARKNYQVIAKDAASWQRIHKELTSQTYNTTNIPDRACLCKNETQHQYITQRFSGTSQLAYDKLSLLYGYYSK